MKYKNIREGEQLHFDLHFLNRIKKQFPGIKAISPEITGPYSQVMNKAKSGLFKIIGINENYMGIKILKINEDGRYFNKGDDENTRNVTIIGENVSTTLFNNQKALGKSINIAGIDFKVIGVLKNDDIFSASEIRTSSILVKNLRPQLDATRLIASVALRVKTISCGLLAFKNLATVCRAFSYSNVICSDSR